MDDAQAAQESLVAASRARIAHLKQLNALTSFSSRSYTSWAHTRLQRHLVDYLLRRGYTGSAHLLREEEGLDGLDNVELDLFTEVQRIETALAGGSAAMALAWCKDNSTALKKGNVRGMLRWGPLICTDIRYSLRRARSSSIYAFSNLSNSLERRSERKPSNTAESILFLLQQMLQAAVTASAKLWRYWPFLPTPSALPTAPYTTRSGGTA